MSLWLCVSICLYGDTLTSTSTEDRRSLQTRAKQYGHNRVQGDSLCGAGGGADPVPGDCPLEVPPCRGGGTPARWSWLWPRLAPAEWRRGDTRLPRGPGLCYGGQPHRLYQVVLVAHCLSQQHLQIFHCRASSLRTGSDASSILSGLSSMSRICQLKEKIKIWFLDLKSPVPPATKLKRLRSLAWYKADWPLPDTRRSRSS